MTLHFQDDVATNILTIDATDPKSGTAEFKASGDPHREGRRRPPTSRPEPAEPSALRVPSGRARLARVAPCEALTSPGRWIARLDRRSPTPRAAERAAVDAVPARRSGWDGGETRARNGGPRRHRRPRGARAAAPAPAGAVGRAGARRLDLPRRAQLHLPAAHRPAGGGLRRRDVLRDAVGRAAAADVVHVCDDIACRLAAPAALRCLERSLGRRDSRRGGAGDVAAARASGCASGRRRASCLRAATGSALAPATRRTHVVAPAGAATLAAPPDGGDCR